MKYQFSYDDEVSRVRVRVTEDPFFICVSMDGWTVGQFDDRQLKPTSSWKVASWFKSVGVLIRAPYCALVPQIRMLREDVTVNLPASFGRDSCPVLATLAWLHRVEGFVLLPNKHICPIADDMSQESLRICGPAIAF